MGFTVRVRGVDILCENLDDVNELINKFGSDAPPVRESRPAASRSSAAAGTDMALLRQFVQAGPTGLTSEVIGDMLNARGKGVPPAMRRWALRIGLTQSVDAEPFDPARPKGARGWRLRDGMMHVAKELLGEA